MIQRHSLGWEGSVTVNVLKFYTGDNVLKSCTYYGLLRNFIQSASHCQNNTLKMTKTVFFHIRVLVYLTFTSRLIVLKTEIQSQVKSYRLELLCSSK